MTKSKLIYLFITLIYLFISSIHPDAYAVAPYSERQTTVTANIPGTFRIRIFGYSSPLSIVQIQSVRVFAQVSAARDGYFLFNDLLLSEEAKELCLSAIDSEKRLSFPLCINIPEIINQTEIGPLLLPPTISLSTKVVWQDNTAYATGRTIPSQEVAVSFFTNKPVSAAEAVGNKISRLILPRAEAADLPRLMIKSDEQGQYSFTLPSTYASSYRLFAKTIFENMFTPKSQTLSYSIHSYLEYFLLLILPKLILYAIILGIMIYLLIYEYKTKKARAWISDIIDRRSKFSEIMSPLMIQKTKQRIKDLIDRR